MKKLLKKIITSLVAEELAPLKKEVIGILMEQSKREAQEQQAKMPKKSITIIVKLNKTITRAINEAVSKATNNN